MKSSSSFSFSVKVAALSTAALSAAVTAKLMIPPFLRFAACKVPRMYSSALSWLTPPYLYFVVNCIIITIAASSRFHVTSADDEEDRESKFELVEVVKEAPTPPPPVEETPPKEEKEVEEEEEFVISRSDWTPASRNRAGGEYFAGEEKPPISSRFGSRKSVRASPEGNALRVARPKKSETLESTWKMITDGRAPPLARHLKKSDTWETQGKVRTADLHSPVKKSQTFDERRKVSASPSPGSSGGSGRLRREPSLSQDELNRRVEAFINKFNQEMRLQRQESDAKYIKMVGRSK